MDYLKDERGAPGEVNIGELVLTVWRRRWWVIASVVLFTTLFGLFWFFSRPVYRATIIMVPAGTRAGRARRIACRNAWQCWRPRITRRIWTWC